MLYVPNVSRRRNDSFAHILRSLRFLNANWHKKRFDKYKQPVAIIERLHQS